MQPKPGYRSTEFYGSGLVSVLGAAAAAGLITPEVADMVAEGAPEVVQIIQSIIDGIIRISGIIGAIYSQVKYGQGRAVAKKPPVNKQIIVKK